MRTAGGLTVPQMVGRGEIDFASTFAGTVVYNLDAGVPVTVLAGLHSGCFELFTHGPIQSIGDLKGRRVGIQSLSSSAHLYMAIMAAQVGLDPHEDLEWVVPPDGKAMELFAERKVDAFLGFPPEPQELRARKIGRMILSTTTDKPWSDYFCCMVFGNREFVRTYPVATKRYLRALLKATDLCATEPERAAQGLIDAGFTPRYDYALQTLTETPYDRWREFDPEDSMRFFALRLHEVGHDQVEPERASRRGHRLALPERAQARAEGMRRARQSPGAGNWKETSDADHPVSPRFPGQRVGGRRGKRPRRPGIARRRGAAGDHHGPH